MSSFTPSSYMGNWYEQRRDKNFIFEGGDCSTASYRNLRESSTKFDVLNGLMHYESKSVIYVDGIGKCLNGAKCTVQFTAPTSFEGKYHILATDYTNYAVVYSCSEFLGIPNFFKTEYGWILSRAQSIPAASLTTATAALNNVGYSVSSDIIVNQYYFKNYHSEE